MSHKSWEAVVEMKYSIAYKFIDFDSKRKIQFFNNWKDACKFMKSLLDDGYIILAVNG